MSLIFIACLLAAIAGILFRINQNVAALLEHFRWLEEERRENVRLSR